MASRRPASAHHQPLTRFHAFAISSLRDIIVSRSIFHRATCRRYCADYTPISPSASALDTPSLAPARHPFSSRRRPIAVAIRQRHTRIGYVMHAPNSSIARRAEAVIILAERFSCWLLPQQPREIFATSFELSMYERRRSGAAHDAARRR